MSGTTWSKFFWSDWETDPALRLCSYAAQGLWMRMLCIAASHDPIGYVAVAGRALDATDIARMTGGSEGDVQTLLVELDRNGVCSRDRHGRIYSRRMVRDAKASATARKNGKLGGNPSLRKDGGNPPLDKPPFKPKTKPHKPSPIASTKVEAPHRASTLGDANGSARHEGASPPRLTVVPKTDPPRKPVKPETKAERDAIIHAILAQPKPNAPPKPPPETQEQMVERLRKSIKPEDAA